MASKSEILQKYRRCILEYTNTAGAYNLHEEGEEDMDMGPNMGGGAPDMGGDPNAGMDPNMGGGAPNMDGGAPDMGGDPNAGMDPNMDGGAPDMGGGEGANGFDPQGGDPNAGLDGMGGDPNAGMDPNMNGGQNMDNQMGPDDEIIDVDELVKSQEKAEEKIDKMNSKFEKLMGAIETLITQNKEMERREQEAKAELKAEMEKRMPTPKQRLSMRSTKSSPYSMTPNDYMNNYVPDNYSAEDDNNGADDAQYKITKGDIDNFTDYNSIAKALDVEHQGLRDILGF
jgi:hypothetical protein